MLRRIKRILADTRGFLQYVFGAVALIAIAITLAIGVVVVAEVQRAVTTSSLSAAAQTAVGKVFNTTYTAFGLAPFVMYGIIAGLIVAAIIGIIGFIRLREG